MTVCWVTLEYFCCRCFTQASIVSSIGIINKNVYNMETHLASKLAYPIVVVAVV